MKRKIAILLAAVMTVSAAPMTAMAASSNSVNKTVNVKTGTDGGEIEGVYVTIQPKDEVVYGDSVIITVENAEFDEDEYPVEQYSVKGDNMTSDQAMTWDKAVKLYTSGKAENVYLANILKDNGTLELPYSIKVTGKNEIEVKLFPVSDKYTDKDYTIDSDNKGKPVYKIPVNVIAQEEGDVKVTVNSNETAISGGTYTIAYAANTQGSTTASVSEIKYFQDSVVLDDIVIRETVSDTFEAGKKVQLKVSGGFEFVSGYGKVEAGTNLTSVNVTDMEWSGSTVTFSMPAGDTKKASAIRVTGLKVVPKDEDDDWGDVNVTVKGSSAGITTETIKVAERQDYGAKLSVVEDPTTIVSGRLYTVDTDDMDEDDFVTAEFKFEETIVDTLLSQRKVTFEVPEGVKIVDFSIEDQEGFAFDKSMFMIAEEGKQLVLKRDSLSNGSRSSVDPIVLNAKLYLSADPSFQGDVTVKAYGGGIAEDLLDAVVVAKVVAPITITSATTKTNMGYQSVNTADITITEVAAGIIPEGKEVVVALDSIFGSDELGFTDDDLEVVVDGDMEVSDLDVDGGKITFEVESESFAAPASITIKNIRVGSTRSIPYGSYGFTVGGEALINNYTEIIDDGEDEYDFDVEYANDADLKVGMFDDSDKFEFADYISIVTETGTLDKVVKVTIDQKTILVDEESYDMDVAPYIQAASNSTMVPLRFVSVALGVDSANVANPDDSGKVTYDPNSKTATIYYAAGQNTTVIKFQAGSNIMVVNGTEIPMEYGVKAEIQNDRMFVPFRALGTALGVNVSWDADTRTATYNA